MHNLYDKDFYVTENSFYSCMNDFFHRIYFIQHLYFWMGKKGKKMNVEINQHSHTFKKKSQFGGDLKLYQYYITHTVIVYYLYLHCMLEELQRFGDL